MIRLTQRLTTEEAAGKALLTTLTLPIDLRIKSRLKVTLDNGDAAGLFLTRGQLLRGGECLTDDAGAVVVMDETRCMVKSLLRLSYFYYEESCGQCTPCREGTGWLYRMVDRIEHGKGRPEDLDMLDNVAQNIQGRTICALGDAAAMPVRAFLKHYRDEFQYHIDHKKCLVAPYI